MSQLRSSTRFHLDDEPSDGPDQYVYLSGFYTIGLLNALEAVGVRVDTITNVSCGSVEDTARLFEEMIQRERQEQTLKADVLKDTRTYTCSCNANARFSALDRFQARIPYVRRLILFPPFLSTNEITQPKRILPCLTREISAAHSRIYPVGFDAIGVFVFP